VCRLGDIDLGVRECSKSDLDALFLDCVRVL